MDKTFASDLKWLFGIIYVAALFYHLVPYYMTTDEDPDKRRKAEIAY